MKTKHQISIVIPTWNTAYLTLKNINSLKKYLPSGFAEIIIVDNASSDDTQDLFSNMKDICYIRNLSNYGFSKANNIGAQNSSAPYLLFLNSDMELVNNGLVEMLNFYKSQPNCGIVGAKLLYPDHKPQGSVFPDQSIINSIKEFWFNFSSFSKYYPVNTSPAKVWAVTGGALLISKKIFDRVNGWNEGYFMYYEDLEICRDVRNLKKNIYYFPDCQFIHQHGASGKHLANSQNQWRRLIPSSIKYHGFIKHFIINFIIKSGQNAKKIFKY